jgi:hypothetical protein
VIGGIIHIVPTPLPEMVPPIHENALMSISQPFLNHIGNRAM